MMAVLCRRVRADVAPAPAHPYVLMVLASTAIVWQDPIMNWAPYAVYNPSSGTSRRLAAREPVAHGRAVHRDRVLDLLLHCAVLREHVDPAPPPGACVRRLVRVAPPAHQHGALLFVTGFVIDAILEIFCVKNGLYIYSQVIPWGSLYAGTTFQFPLIWESSLVTVVMIPAGVLCYRDDTGRTQAEKLVQRFRWLPNRPALGTFLMMFAILNVAYFMYGAGFAAIRASKLATSVACPWPFPEAKVYDPNGFYEREGQPGPFFEGHWNTWMSAQPAVARP